MTFESVRRFGKRVSKLSRYRTSLGHKKRTKNKDYAPATNKSVISLIEQAGSDYAKGETDLAIYRLARVLSSMERECTSLESHVATSPVPPPAGVGQPFRNPFVTPAQDHDTTPLPVGRKPPPRRLLLRDELAYCSELQGLSPTHTGLPTVFELAQSQGTVLVDDSTRVAVCAQDTLPLQPLYPLHPPLQLQTPQSPHNDDSNATLRNVDSQVFEFSDLVERSFNLLTIDESITALDDDTARFEDRVFFLNNSGPETVWSKTVEN
ncbi:LAME_0G06612g1_1 [Lachancea meyersii CBS 8951]|uniref:LAME_0G06612g1_1 n=1 Tax=Lachancea meyersii CBS 8951 TaxID=1266667 RepID=A0A1G4K7Q8_9SACH|nr:LAME_0G06612g1_1 [Lachancea meyersii CBS 8951]